MDTFSKIKELIVKQVKRKNINPDDIKLETSLDNLGFDSLDVAELVIEIETEFAIKKQLEQEELVNVKCVRDIVDIVNERLKNCIILQYCT